jgi:hypothetical protein
VTHFDISSGLLQYGINYGCKNLMAQGPARLEYTMATLRVGSHSCPQIFPRVEVTPVTNTLAYCNVELATATKSFMIQMPAWFE